MIVTEWDMNPEPEQNREVFARFGLAMYHAQCLERQLAIILASKYGPDPSRLSSTEFEKILEDLFRRSLGQLVSNITTLSALSDDDEERLKKALEKRNWLAHRYFWDRAVELLSERGRAAMISELQDTAHLFDSLDKFFTGKTFEWGASFGFTQELVDKEMMRLIGDRKYSSSPTRRQDEG